MRKDQAETSVLFELIAARYERRSLIVTANHPFGEWTSVFPDAAMTLAAVDRLVHHSTIFEMNVESYRRRVAAARTPRKAARAPATASATTMTSARHRMLSVPPQRHLYLSLRPVSAPSSTCAATGHPAVAHRPSFVSRYMGFSVSRAFRCHLLPFYLRQFLCSVGGPFLRPGLRRPRARCGAAVDIGRSLSPKAARSDIDGCERGATLDQVGFTVLSAHSCVSAAC